MVEYQYFHMIQFALKFPPWVCVWGNPDSQVLRVVCKLREGGEVLPCPGWALILGLPLCGSVAWGTPPEPLCASVFSEDDPASIPGSVPALLALQNGWKKQGSIDRAIA